MPTILKKQNLSIQEYLSLGYIFLLILGIISDVIYFRFLGINILSYTTISDVLLSPVNLLSENIIIPIAVIVGVVFLYYNRTKWGPKSHERNKHKKWYRLLFNVEKLDKKYQSEFTLNDTLKLIALGVFVVFLGLRIGMGSAVRNKMKNTDLKLKNIIEFKDGEQLKIALLGQNSLYLFYVEKGDTKLTISPIEENIKKIISIDVEETEVEKN